MSILVRVDMTINVDLPEGDDENSEGEVAGERRERAIEAALSALPQRIDLFIDGEDKDPARIFIDVSDSDVTEVWEE